MCVYIYIEREGELLTSAYFCINIHIIIIYILYIITDLKGVLLFP